MPWKARQTIVDKNGSIYAHRGAVMDDDDPVALRNPTNVVAVGDEHELTIFIHEPKVIIEDPDLVIIEEPPEEYQPPDFEV